jgi:hypothetical protein
MIFVTRQRVRTNEQPPPSMHTNTLMTTTNMGLKTHLESRVLFFTTSTMMSGPEWGSTEGFVFRLVSRIGRTTRVSLFHWTSVSLLMVEDYKMYVVTNLQPLFFFNFLFNRYTSTITLPSFQRHYLLLTATPKKKFDNDH